MVDWIAEGSKRFRLKPNDETETLIFFIHFFISLHSKTMKTNGNFSNDKELLLRGYAPGGWQQWKVTIHAVCRINGPEHPQYKTLTELIGLVAQIFLKIMRDNNSKM